MEQLKDRITNIFYNVLDSQAVFFRAKKIPLSLAEIHTLVAISADENQTMSELAEKRHITVSTLSINISKLEKKGYVKREKDTVDRRVVRCRLMTKAKTVVNAYKNFYAELTQAIVSRLNQEESAIFLRSLVSIDEFIEDTRKNGK